MIGNRVLTILFLLVSNCAVALSLANDVGEPEAGDYGVWFRDVQLEIPDSFVVDVRYYTEEEGLIILREIVDGVETGSTIGLSLQPLDTEALDAFRGVGYSHSRYCEFDVFGRSDETVRNSKIVVVSQGFVQLTNLKECLVEKILESLCEEFAAED